MDANNICAWHGQRLATVWPYLFCAIHLPDFATSLRWFLVHAPFWIGNLAGDDWCGQAIRLSRFQKQIMLAATFQDSDGRDRFFIANPSVVGSPAQRYFFFKSPQASKRL